MSQLQIWTSVTAFKFLYLFWLFSFFFLLQWSETRPISPSKINWTEFGGLNVSKKRKKRRGVTGKAEDVHICREPPNNWLTAWWYAASYLRQWHALQLVCCSTCTLHWTYTGVSVQQCLCAWMWFLQQLTIKWAHLPLSVWADVFPGGRRPASGCDQWKFSVMDEHRLTLF